MISKLTCGSTASLSIMPECSKNKHVHVHAHTCAHTHTRGLNQTFTEWISFGYMHSS
jgi:hypothetical protein